MITVDIPVSFKNERKTHFLEQTKQHMQALCKENVLHSILVLTEISTKVAKQADSSKTTDLTKFVMSKSVIHMKWMEDTVTADEPTKMSFNRCETHSFVERQKNLSNTLRKAIIQSKSSLWQTEFKIDLSQLLNTTKSQRKFHIQ